MSPGKEDALRERCEAGAWSRPPSSPTAFERRSSFRLQKRPKRADWRHGRGVSVARRDEPSMFGRQSLGFVAVRRCTWSGRAEPRGAKA